MSKLEDIEISLLLDAVERCYGYRFHEYAEASLSRRIKKFKDEVSSSTISALIPKIVHNRIFFEQLLQCLSVTVTELFRTPEFFVRVRETIIPWLRTWPYIKIWHAGCATGEEAYSMAILLLEEGLLEKTQMYATDFNEKAIAVAHNAIYSKRDLTSYEENYQLAGGKGNLSNYYNEMYGSFKFKSVLRSKIIFAEHNLVTDGAFGEMHLIICRNVLIYFKSSLRNRVCNLFMESLQARGAICLGANESGFNLSSQWGRFEVVDKRQNIFRKKIC